MMTATRPTTSPIPNAALRLVHSGFQIVLVDPRSKRPLGFDGSGRNWLESAMSDEESFATQFEHFPQANISLPLGPESGIIDIECDTPDAENEFTALFGEANTPTYETRRGKHRLFRWTPAIASLIPGKSVAHIGGMEFRVGNNGKATQSICPPSVHPETSQPYRWLLSPDDVDVAEISADVLKRLAGILAATDGNKRTSLSPQRIQSGQRNNSLTSIAGSLRRQGLSENGIRDTLAGFNREQCDPPLPDSEVAGIARSVARYAPPTVSVRTVNSVGNVADYKWTDYGNAERLRDRHGANIRYCHPWT